MYLQEKYIWHTVCLKMIFLKFLKCILNIIQSRQFISLLLGSTTGSKSFGMCLECLCQDPDERVPPKYEFLMTPKG